jgi:hypothetical protein
MTRVVESVAAEYGQSLSWEKVVIKQREGARRFRELSQILGRPAPVPSIFVEGQLVFDMTPGQEELRACLDGLLAG